MMNKRRPSLTTSGGSFRQRPQNDGSTNTAVLNHSTSHSNDTPLHNISSNATTSSNAPSRRNKRSVGSSVLSEDRLMSLFLIMLAAWFLYARYQESKLLLLSATNTQRADTSAYEEHFGVYNTNRNRHITTQDFTSNNNNDNYTASSQSNFFPTADDDEISNSKYLRGRESGSGGGFMPQEIKELLVMGGVDKGPPPHFSRDHRTNPYRKNTPMQPAEEKVSPSIERLDSSEII